MKRNVVLDAALAYVAKGWSVIPISPTSKRPLVKWKPFTERHPTQAEIRKWWAKWPRANVAILTGTISGLVVADIDPDKGGDADEWIRSAPSPLTVSTRRGGVHCYYSTTGDATPTRNSVGRVAHGVDVRGEAGYVLAPPSKGYTWRAGSPLELREGLPPWRTRHEDRGSTNASTEHWIERTLQGVTSGERNNACARLAGYFLGKGSPPDIVTQQLLAWNRLNDPPLPIADIRTTVESVARTERDRRRGESHHPKLRLETDDSGDSPYPIIGFDRYLAKYGHQKVSWLVNGWLPRETVGMVVAPPGSYKTWLLQDLAVSVATGLPFLGQFPVGKQGPVLFMQQEDWHGQIAHRFALITYHRAGLYQPKVVDQRLVLRAPPKVPIYLHEHRRFRFGDEEIVQAWADQIKRIRPALVVLDPLYSAGSVDDFMAGTASAMFIFKQIRDAYGTSFLISHHTRKRGREITNGKPSDVDREDAWGSQFLNAWIETGWQIRRRAEIGSATILRHFKIQSEQAKAVISFNIDTTQLPTKYDVAVKEISEGEEPAADVVRLIEINGGMSVAQLVKATELPRTTIYRRLENLTKAGVVGQVNGKYVLSENLNA